MVHDGVTDGCLAHETAVAAGALSQYLKFQTLQYPKEYLRIASLDGINYLLRENVNSLPTFSENFGTDNIHADTMKNQINPLNNNINQVNNVAIVGEEKEFDTGDADLIKDLGNNEQARRLRDRYDAHNIDVDADDYLDHDDAEDGYYEDDRRQQYGDDNREQYDDVNQRRYAEGDDVVYNDDKDDVDVVHRKPEQEAGQLVKPDSPGASDEHKFLPVPRDQDNDVFRLGYEEKQDEDDYDDDDKDYNSYGNDVMEARQNAVQVDDNGNFANDVYANPKFQPLLNERLPEVIEQNDDDDQQYSYDERLQDSKLAADRAAVVDLQHVAADARTSNAASLPPILRSGDSKQMLLPPPVEHLSITTSYLILFSCMAVLLIFMFKFIRARRVIIRYKYG